MKDDNIRKAFEEDYETAIHFNFGEDGYYHTKDKAILEDCVTINRIFHGYRSCYKSRDKEIQSMKCCGNCLHLDNCDNDHEEANYPFGFCILWKKIINKSDI